MLRSFSVVALAGYLSFYLVDGSKAAHAMTNILPLLIPLFEACTHFFCHILTSFQKKKKKKKTRTADLIFKLLSLCGLQLR